MVPLRNLVGGHGAQGEEAVAVATWVRNPRLNISETILGPDLVEVRCRSKVNAAQSHPSQLQFRISSQLSLCGDVPLPRVGHIGVLLEALSRRSSSCDIRSAAAIEQVRTSDQWSI